MNIFLEKIAETISNETPREPKKIGAIPAAAAGFFGVTRPVSLLATPSLARTMSVINKPDSAANLSTIKKTLRDGDLYKKVTLNTRDHSVAKAFPGSGMMDRSIRTIAQNAPGPAYIPSSQTGGKGIIIGTRKSNFKGIFGNTQSGRDRIINKDVIMHELGHAKDMATHTKLKTRAAMMGGHAIPGKLAGLGASTALLSSEKTEKYAPIASAVPGLITLRQEGAANYHAYKQIAKHQGKATANKFLKKFVPHQMAAYAIPMAAPVIGTAVAGKVIKHTRQKNEEHIAKYGKTS